MGLSFPLKKKIKKKKSKRKKKIKERRRKRKRKAKEKISEREFHIALGRKMGAPLSFLRPYFGSRIKVLGKSGQLSMRKAGRFSKHFHAFPLLSSWGSRTALSFGGVNFRREMPGHPTLAAA